MNTAWQKMVSGEEYQADDPEIIRVLNLTKDAIRAYNQIQPTRLEEREKAIRKIIGKCGVKPFFNQPFLCDYGVNIRVGDRFFANFNFTVLDEAYVTIGDDVFIGPNVSLYTACHSTDPVERNTRREWAEPITIGNNV